MDATATTGSGTRQRFIKASGLGNDFVVVPCFDRLPGDPHALARSVCDRRRGIGADGLILVTGPQRPEAHLRMIIHNPDGSRAELCGNGLRCVAMLAWRRGWCRRRQMRIETDADVHEACLTLCSGQVRLVRVAMGRVGFAPASVGIDGREPWLDHPLDVAGVRLAVCCASIGNPHAVVFVESLDAVAFERLGPAIERHPAFARGVNVHFAQVVRPDVVRVRTWERGCGPTDACASGACVIVATGVRTQRVAPRAAVQFPGGVVRVRYEPQSQHVWQSGPARIDFEGTLPAGSPVDS